MVFGVYGGWSVQNMEVEYTTIGHVKRQLEGCVQSDMFGIEATTDEHAPLHG